MSGSNPPSRPEAAFEALPRIRTQNNEKFLPAPSHASFASRFGDVYPKPSFLDSDLGRTAVYDLPAPAPTSSDPPRRVLLVHGLNTPALGLLSLARALQAADPSTHVALFDLWGHGLSSTPLAPHAPHVFAAQISQVLGFLGWGRRDAHLVGYSFGGSMVAQFALHHPWAAASVALLAPVGVMRVAEATGPVLFRLLTDSSGGRDGEAAERVLEFFEDGPAVVVPPDWRERVERGEVVPQALRQWQRDEHPGFRQSLLSMFREDGNVSGCEERFRGFARLGCKKVVVLAELDNVCTKDQLNELGLDDVEVIKGVGHELVRSVPADVARIIHRMWTQ